MSLLEALLVAALMALCFGLVLVLTRNGMRVTQKVERQGDLLQQMQVAHSLFSRDAMATSLASASWDAYRLAMVSPRLEDQPPTLSDLQSNLNWPAYRVYYWDASQGLLATREVARPSSNSQALPLDSVDLGSGVQPLSFYATAGKTLAEGVTSVVFLREGSQLLLRIEARREGYGPSDRLRTEFRAAPRNP